jgi:hypothetical protein
MQFGLAKRKPGDIEFGIIYGMIALLALFAARLLPVLKMAPACTFRALTGLPCPTCGATRAVVHLAEGHLLSALAMNPLAFSVFVLALLALLYGGITLLFGLPRVTFTLEEHEKRRFRIFCIIVLLADWSYLMTVLR